VKHELEPVLALTRMLPREDLAEWLADLEHIRIVGMSRLLSPTVETQSDQLLDIDETAARMHVSKDYLYRNSKRLAFTRRIGRKLLFSSSGLNSYLQQRERRK
jgi:hypothetical protein